MGKSQVEKIYPVYVGNYYPFVFEVVRNGGLMLQIKLETKIVQRFTFNVVVNNLKPETLSEGPLRGTFNIEPSTKLSNFSNLINIKTI
jgi:hypothetical protein